LLASTPTVTSSTTRTRARNGIPRRSRSGDEEGEALTDTVRTAIATAPARGARRRRRSRLEASGLCQTPV
jgi:hypothetical protein